MDLIPGLSQIKSAVQIITGDVKGAERTQERFWHESPGFSQVTTVVYAATGNISKANDTAERGIKTMGAIADGVPVVGHAKGIVHYACGDEAAGDRAMKAASRTAVVLGAGAGGMLVGGPAGAMAAGVYAGAATDTVYSAVSGKNEGLVKAIETAVENPNAGNILDAAFIPVADAATGYAGGQMANAVKNSSRANASGSSNIVKSSKISAQEASSWSRGGSSGSSGYSSYATKAAYTKPVPLATSIATAAKAVANAAVVVPPTAVAIGCTAGAAVSAHNRIVTSEKTQPYEEYERMKKKQKTKSTEWSERPISVSIEEELRELVKRMAQQSAANYEVGLSVLMKSVEVQTWKELVELAEKSRDAIKKLLKMIKKNKTKEGSESDSSSSSDEEKKKIRCLQWNLCGIRAQLTAKNLGFLIYLKFMNPDVILLNELKMEHGVELLARTIGYEAIVSPSVSPRGTAMRGSAVLYKKAKLQNSGVATITHPLSEDLEYAWGDLTFGETTRRFVSCYLRELRQGEFPILIDIFKRISVNQWTVIGGDLNLRKEDYLTKFGDNQYVDAMKPSWKTNRSPTNQTAIDYVLSSPDCNNDILAHRPFPIGGKMVHYPIIFEIEEDLNEENTWCKDPTCFLCISSRLTETLLKAKERITDIIH